MAKYPADERAHFLLGGAYFGRQEYDKAIAEYRKATELNPRFSPAYNLLGYAYRAVDQFGDAETAFRKYIELIPGDPNPYDSYAELLMKTGPVRRVRRAVPEGAQRGFALHALQGGHRHQPHAPGQARRGRGDDGRACTGPPGTTATGVTPCSPRG